MLYTVLLFRKWLSKELCRDKLHYTLQYICNEAWGKKVILKVNENI